MLYNINLKCKIDFDIYFYLVATRTSFLLNTSLVSPHCLLKYSATGLAGNSVSQTYPKSLARWIASPSTRDVNKVTLQAFLLPAGRVIPSLSSLSRRCFPPSLDFALLRTPPNSEALRHSGGLRRLWTSAMVTLYLDVDERRDSLPGVEQKMSEGKYLIEVAGGGWGVWWSAGG